MISINVVARMLLLLVKARVVLAVINGYNSETCDVIIPVGAEQRVTRLSVTWLGP